VPRSDSQKATAPRGDDARGHVGSHEPAAEAKKRALICIVASPRSQVGKTFVARLLTDFLRLDGGKAAAFDLNQEGEALRDYLPGVATAADLGEVRGQMALFDRLIVDDGVAKVIDVGHASFERFFAITQEIRFFEEARRRGIEPMILFAADPHPAAVKGYANLQRRVRSAVLVPVFNEAIVKGRNLRDKFPFAQAVGVPLQIPVLSPMLMAQVDKSSYSFADFHDRLPMPIPLELAFELRTWTRRTFLEFRELELRLLLDRLRTSLGPDVTL
jgi:hypothetical protein